jgi:glycine/D-amino acid oxidase-like deaminating enzyme
MSRIVVIGGGMIGLSTALMLDRAGHDVTVVERDDGISRAELLGMLA